MEPDLGGVQDTILNNPGRFVNPWRFCSGSVAIDPLSSLGFIGKLVKVG
jgi:hypothetical protein